MTTETQGKEQVSEADQAKADAEAQAAFDAGFNRVRGEAATTTEKTDTETTTAGETPADKKVAAPTIKVEAAPAPDPWKDVPEVVRKKFEALDALPSQIRNIAGQYGGLNSKIDSLIATAKTTAAAKGADAPSDKQVQAAIGGGSEAWKKLKEDYPDWAEPLEAELNAMRAEFKKAGAAPVDVNALRTEVTAGFRNELSSGLDAAEERAFVRLKHPDWKQTVNTPEFRAWTLEGGPSQEQYAQMKALERTDPTKADALVNNWARQHPQWWADRGAAIFDDRADAAIALLDGYKAARAQPAAGAEQKRQKPQTRLERAVPAAGSGGEPPITGLSDEAAFNRGFNRVRGSKN